MRPFWLQFAGMIALVTLAVSCPAASTRSGAFLEEALRLSHGELRSLDAGHAVVRMLPHADRHGIGVAGAIRVAVSPEMFVEQVRDIAHFKRDHAVTQIGVFSHPPRLSDVAALIWPIDDVQPLKECEVGDCDLLLPAEAIERFHREVDWSSIEPAAKIAELARRFLVEWTASYIRLGDSALPLINDRDQPLSLGRQFHDVVSSSPSPLDLVPAFRRYLEEFPEYRLPGVENLFYWSSEKLGFRQVISVNHVAIYHPARETGISVIIGSRQIYATRYLDASLGVTALMSGTGQRDGAYDVVYFNQSRTDEFDGFLGRIKRSIVNGRVRSAVGRYLRILKTRLESANGRAATSAYK